MTTQIFDLLLGLSGWKETDGPIPGVWVSRPIGSRALWSVKWSFYGGLAQPDQMKPLDDMTQPEMYFELSDINGLWHIDKPELAARAKAIVATANSDPEGKWDIGAWSVLRESRASPREFVFAPMPPAKGGFGGLMRLTDKNVRRGWGTKQEIMQASAAMPARFKTR